MSREDKNHSSGLILSNHDFFCQTNPEIHRSPAMHDVQDNFKNVLYDFMKVSGKFTFFGSFMVQFFLITNFCTCISLKNKLYANILETFLTWWPF